MRNWISKAMSGLLAAASILAAGDACAQITGEQGFVDNCSACHQKTGVGIAGAFPALAGDTFVQGDPAIVAATVLNGRGGMPAFKDSLDDPTLAAILTYVRSAWGNKAGPMTAGDFSKVRNGPPPSARLQAH